MRRFLLLVVLLLAAANPVSASTSLESLIQSATGIVRTVDIGLQARAAVRAVEIQINFGHCCIGPNEAEVIADNAGQADPVGYLVNQWLNSAPHRAILLNPDYTAIGCATAQAGGWTYGVCLFRTDSAVPPVVVLPNTAMRQR